MRHLCEYALCALLHTCAYARIKTTTTRLPGEVTSTLLGTKCPAEIAAQHLPKCTHPKPVHIKLVGCVVKGSSLQAARNSVTGSHEYCGLILVEAHACELSKLQEHKGLGVSAIPLFH